MRGATAASRVARGSAQARWGRAAAASRDAPRCDSMRLDVAESRRRQVGGRGLAEGVWVGFDGMAKRDKKTHETKKTARRTTTHTHEHQRFVDVKREGPTRTRSGRPGVLTKINLLGAAEGRRGAVEDLVGGRRARPGFWVLGPRGIIIQRSIAAE